MILKYCNLDIIPTDEKINFMFGGFNESEPFSDRFEEIGYDSSNYFLLLGALLILMIVFIVWLPIRKVFKVFANRAQINCC